MKIVAGVNGRTIADYFGRSEQFIIFDVEDGQITGEEIIANPGHTRRISPPSYVAKLGVRVVIGGTVGRIAFNIMKKRGIQVIAGASGDANKAVEDYLKGRLATDESAIETRDSPMA